MWGIFIAIDISFCHIHILLYFKVLGACQFSSSGTPVSTVNTRVTGSAQFDTDFNGSVGTSHISDCKRTGSCGFFGKKKRSIETAEA